MFILIPLLLIVCSVAGIAVVIWRKKAYINKLYLLNTAGGGSEGSIDGTDSNPSVSIGFSWKDYGADFFPEIKDLLEKLKLQEHKTIWLKEAEKILRKTRLVSLRVDNFSDSLIKKIRQVHVNRQLNVKTPEAPVEVADREAVSKSGSMSPAFLKNEEQRLVMEIAQNPKNPDLYESLGDLYVEMDNIADAKESYEAAIELSPHNESLKVKLSGVLAKMHS